MRAAFYEANGPAREVLKIGEVPTPEPGFGEVRVKLATSGVNPSDVKSRSGRTRKIAYPRVVPHSDGAGVIDRVGPGVLPGRVGERVWVWNAQWKRPFGTAAEYVCLPSHQAVKLPDDVGFEVGACLGIPALTASEAVALAGKIEGRPILVAGGAGAVAHYAIQFARMKGATVITTVSSPEKAAHARAAGAEHVIDYKREDVGARVKDITGGEGVAAVLEVDLSANAPLAPKVLAPHGRLVVYGTGPEATLEASWFLYNCIKVEFTLVYELEGEHRRRGLREVRDCLAAGTLQHTIARRLPLDRIAEAHELVEQGAVIGKVVIDLP
ncbi:MAG: NADPH:quinone reductase [Rhodospirillales bacterium]|nr:NADPH:quinone reductase [Rhodospirillales bacterium]